MKVLLIRFSSIGDIILTTPLIRALREQLSGVEIHYLTKEKYLPVLAENPYLDRILTIDKKVAEIRDELRNAGYDYVLDLHHNFRSSQVRSLVKAPSAVFQKVSLRKWIFATFRWNTLPEVHVVDRYMDVAQPLGVQTDAAGLDYFLGPMDEVLPEALPASYREGAVAVVIGGQHPGKLYPEDYTATLCRLLNQPVILLGGPEDYARGECIREAGGAQVYNACGAFSLNQSIALLRNASCVVTNDTGLMHAAAALQKRVISLWGATVPEFGMAPYRPGPGSQILEPSCACHRPYSKLGNKVFYKRAYDCWDGLEPEVVAAAVRGGAEADSSL